MEARISEIKPLMADAWGRQQQMGSQTAEVRQIKPVPRNEGGGLSQLDSNKKEAQGSQGKNEVKRDDLENLVKDVEDYLTQMRVDLSFKLHEGTGEVVVQVISEKTGEVVRQLPPEEVLELREKLKDLRGVLFDGKI